MLNKNINIALILFFVSISFWANATHNRAGEITYKQIGDPSEYKFEIKLTTYTEVQSTANRNEVDIYFGDNSSETVRIDYPGHIKITDNIYLNTYTTTHIYPGPGIYTIEFIDPNRVRDIRNMSNSVMTPFYVNTELQISLSRGINRSPVLLQPPIDFAKKGAVFEHNPTAYDADGDSLSFSLIPPSQGKGVNVYNYYIPYGKNGFNIDPLSGHLTWDYPDTVGIYNIAILVEEYREGKRIGYIIRDMQIQVYEDNNHPPQIDPISDTCIEAGKSLKLSIPIHASDPDKSQIIRLSGAGGPFILPSKARLTPPPTTNYSKDAYATFNWTPSCSDIRLRPYSVVIKVYDSSANDPRHITLTDLEHFFVRVVGPAPENLQVANSLKGIELNWDPPSGCNNAWGYYIYRKVDSSYWDTSRCETGIPAYSGFKLIDSTFGINRTSYTDNNKGQGLIPGITYCYRVTAYYVGVNYELTEGYASNEVCARQLKDVPVLTHVDVRETDNSNGKIYIDWSLPDEIDTQLYEGPYRLELWRSEGSTIGQKSFITQFNAATFSELKDSIWLDQNLDSRTKQWAYQVDFYGTAQGSEYFIGNAQAASSIFLTIKQGHENLKLSWNETVPWSNKYYVIYKFRNGAFDSLATTKNHFYYDTGLVNGVDYCYKIMSYGSFSSKNFVSPLLNFSQEVCQHPVDTIPPPPPVLTAKSNCDGNFSDLRWWFIDTLNNDDIVAFNIYYSELLNESYSKIMKVNGKNERAYTDSRAELEHSLAGCYKITAIDSYGNESVYSNRACVDNCPDYKLPNIFTPNGDGINDIYHPIGGAKHIEKIDMYIFNRWGQLVYQTSDPEINWDGKEMIEGLEVSEGVYYYICDVYQIFLDGLKPVTFKGTITIIR